MITRARMRAREWRGALSHPSGPFLPDLRERECVYGQAG